jgi:hypothetical protein
MTRHPVEVYRTSDQEAVAKFRNFEKALSGWDRACRAFASEHTRNANFYSSSMLGQVTMWGLACPDGGPPLGWRHDRRIRSMLVPDKRSKLGKQYARDMAALAKSPRLGDALRGMPAIVHGRSTGQGSKIWAPGVLLTPDGVLECTWDCEVPPGDVDFGIWAKIPLSQYHAEIERKEEP